VAGQFLCEVCFDTLTNHITAVCEDCLAPPAEHACWQELGEAFGVAELRPDEQGEGYLVRFKNGTTIHFRWSRAVRSRRTE